MRRRVIDGYLFIAPFMLGVLIFAFIPIIACIVIGFTQWNFIDFDNISFIGLQNFKDLLTDSIFLEALKATVKYTLFTVPSLAVLSLLVAILVNNRLPLSSFFKTMYFTPGIISGPAVAIAFAFILNSDYGILYEFLGLTVKVNLLGDEHMTIPALAMVCVWQQVSFNFLLYLAALQEIPDQLKEASIIDGAGAVRRFFSITLPMISPTIFTVVITGTMFQMQQFVYSAVITMGRFGSKTLAYYIYEAGFRAGNFGYGSAVAVVFMLLVFLLVLIQWFLQKKWVFYNE